MERGNIPRHHGQIGADLMATCVANPNGGLLQAPHPAFHVREWHDLIIATEVQEDGHSRRAIGGEPR